MIVPTRLVVLATSLAAPLALLALSSTATTAAPSIERVVTLGDSYSAGTGIHRDSSDYDDHGPRAQTFASSTRIGDSDCSRELDETPGPQLAARIGAESVFVACAGARIADVANQIDSARIPDDGAGTVVTMTIGGNDLRTVRGENWPAILVRCITSAGCDSSEKNQIANLDQIRADLTAVYVAIGEQYPDMSVRVLGYPRLMQSDRWCEGVTGFGRGEADWVDDQVDRLNEVISSAVGSASRVTGADIRYVSVVEQFHNHGACRFWQRDRYVNDAVFGETLSRSMTASGEVRDHWDDGPLTISGASFHPSTKGYDAYFAALSASIADLAGATLSR